MTEEYKESLNSLAPLREIIRIHGLRAEKSLGQNFLLDLNLTAKIARTAKTLSKKYVFEVGPGPGGLTRALLSQDIQKLLAIEFDGRAVLALQSLKDCMPDRFEIVEQDALRTHLPSLGKDRGALPPYVIAANLPYNIATPLLTGWLEDIHGDENIYSEMILMFQKEVAQRIVAKPSTKAYGRLSVLCQWLCDVKLAFDIPAGAFTPPPKVTSSVVRFVPKEGAAKGIDFKTMESITAAAFGQRRKMIRSSLKDYMPYVEACGLRQDARAEEVSVEDFVTLARAVTKARL